MLDPDLMGDVVQGELRAELLNGIHGGGEVDSDRESNGTSTTHTHTGNYSVSPRELSLRLHELIQSRLEERIKELETALYQSQRQIHFVGAEQVNSQGDYPNSELGSSSNQESPIMMEQSQYVGGPLCLNLSGDALDAYNEVYEEFLRMAETEEVNPPSPTNLSEQNDGDETYPSDRSLSCSQEGGRTNEFITDPKIFERESRRKQILSHQETDGDEDEDCDFDDEEGRILIQQIVEKTRQGSPVVINAQRILFSMDE